MKPVKLAVSDIPKYTNRDDWTDTIEIAGGYSVRVKVDADTDSGPPWEDSDGHGIVSEWTTRDKAPGERVLHQDGCSKRYYDFAASIALARKDGWDAPPYKTGTKGQQAVRAVEADFEYLRRWCNNDWQYIGVTVEVSKGEIVLESDSLWGIESDGDYWREHAADTANYIIEADRKACKAAAVAARQEKRERQYWEAREVVTVQS